MIIVSWIGKLTWPQYKAIGRHVLTYAAGAATSAAVFGLITQSDATTIGQALQQIGEGAEKIINGIVALAGVLGPIYAAAKAAKAVSPNAQAEAVAKNTQAVTDEARLKLINATAEMPEVKKVVADEPVANATPSPKVVSQ